MNNTGNPDFVKGWFICAAGKPLPDDANIQVQAGYKCCQNTNQLEKEIKQWDKS